MTKKILILFLNILCFSCQLRKTQNESSENKENKENKSYKLNDSLIDNFYRDERLNPKNSDFKFIPVSKFSVDLNDNGKNDSIILSRIENWENDPGDFHQISIIMDNQISWKETNFDGWVRFNENYQVKDSIQKINKLNTDLILLSKFEKSKIICLFGWVYASESGLMTIIDFHLGNPRVIVNKKLEIIGLNEKQILVKENNKKCQIKITNNTIDIQNID